MENHVIFLNVYKISYILQYSVVIMDLSFETYIGFF